MATMNGAFGDLNGKIKNLVVYKSKGKLIVKSIGENKKAASIPQLAVRMRMAVANIFLNHIKPLTDIGYEWIAKASDKNQQNEASSYHTKHAMQGEYPNISLDYSKVMISIGTLEAPKNPLAVKLNTGIEFSWDTPADMGWDIKHDRSMILLYFPETSQAINITIGAARHSGKDFIELDQYALSQPFEAYLAFSASDRKSVSNSVHLGSF